jgi:hypothetical protein
MSASKRFARSIFAFLFLLTATVSRAGARNTLETTRVPPQVAKAIHLRASDVPRLPHEEKWFDNPYQWPDSHAFAGRRGAIEAIAYDGDSAIFYQRQLKKVPPNNSIHLAYVDWRGSIGPKFTWDRHGRLTEKMWYEPYGLGRCYWYDKRGRLRTYHYHAFAGDVTPANPIMKIEEFFGPDGRLEGAFFTYGMGPDPTHWTYWRSWKGYKTTSKTPRKP